MEEVSTKNMNVFIYWPEFLPIVELASKIREAFQTLQLRHVEIHHTRTVLVETSLNSQAITILVADSNPDNLWNAETALKRLPFEKRLNIILVPTWTRQSVKG